MAFEAIGTEWYVGIYEAVEAERFARLEVELNSCVETFDKNYSRFRDDSLVSAIARQSGIYELPPDAKPMMDLYRELYGLTGELVTPLIGQALSDAGYDAEYSLVPGELRQPPAWDDVLRYKWPQLHVLQPVLLDFGAAGKGYLVDLVTAVLELHGVSSYLVDASGDMSVRGPETITIGLEHPNNPEQVIGVARLNNMSLCGSAGNRRAWSKYNHILSPVTLSSPSGIKAVWVSAASTMLADVLTTCLSFVPAAVLADRYQFEYVTMLEDNSYVSSLGFPAELFNS